MQPPATGRWAPAISDLDLRSGFGMAFAGAGSLARSRDAAPLSAAQNNNKEMQMFQPSDLASALNGCSVLGPLMTTIKAPHNRYADGKCHCSGQAASVSSYSRSLP